MSKEKENEYAGLIPNLHTYLKVVKFLRTDKGTQMDTTDLFLTFVKSVLSKFKKADRDAVIALLEIVEREYFVGIQNIALNSLGVAETKYKIGQQISNRKGHTRFIIEIYKSSKNGELEYGWYDTGTGAASTCTEKTLSGWQEK